MIPTLHGPWFACAALALLAAATRRGPRPDRAELLLVMALFAAAAALRLAFGVWGPMHVNGQGPLWIRGALDPGVLRGYGPGYFELFGWVTALGTYPDRAIFAANALLSGLSPALLYGTARLAGVGRGGALAAAAVLAADAVIVRTAASEAYFSALTALVLAVQFALAMAGSAAARGDRVARMLALIAAGLFAAAAARTHPMAYALLALCPLVALCAAQPASWRARVALTAAAAAVIGTTVVLSSATTVIAALRASPMTGQVASTLTLGRSELLLAPAAAAIVVGRWVTGSWLPVISAASLILMLATQASFQQHPLWAGCYQRLFLPGLLLGAAPLLAPRTWSPAWGLASAAAIAGPLFVVTRPSLGSATTEQLEYRFLQSVLRDAGAGCTLAGVSRAGNRMWAIPSYLIPSRGPSRAGSQRAIESPADLAALGSAGCVLYVRSSLCTSIEGRPLCEAVERQASLERVASRVVPAAPSYVGLAYDRPEVEVVVFRTRGGQQASERAAAVDDGAAISPELAKTLYDRFAPLREPDGCRLLRFDTTRFRISAALSTPSGGDHRFELATAGEGDVGRRAGAWSIAVAPELQRDCSMTLAAIERLLVDISPP
jgi:hypothetical protein